jgi:hypothetical protein
MSFVYEPSSSILKKVRSREIKPKANLFEFPKPGTRSKGRMTITQMRT